VQPSHFRAELEPIVTASVTFLAAIAAAILLPAQRSAPVEQDAAGTEPSGVADNDPVIEPSPALVPVSI
jgi:hypothetical protein